MTVHEKQVLNWTSAAAVALAIVAYFISGWVDSIIILALLGMLIGWTISPKLLMFFSYQTILFGFVWYLTTTIWLPLFENQWHWVVNWLRITLLGLTYASLAAGAIASILSCWTSKALTETQIGQWTLSGWMPVWGKNMNNRWYGIFTGLPAGMVKVIACEGVSTTIIEKKSIQIEIDGDPNKRKFEAVFDFNFKKKVTDTFIFISNKHADKDLVNLIIKALTSYLNDPANKYKEVSGMLKGEIGEIQKKIITAIADSESLYGEEMSDFKLVDIENPESVIKQQIADAAAMKAQVESDARELKDTKALDAQVKYEMKAAKKAGSPITYKEAVEIVQTQRQLIQSTKITGNARPIVLADAGGNKKKKKGGNSTP